jgi:branched-chain amino acid transport system permease protein
MEAIGFPVLRFRLAAFIIAGAAAGLAGALLASQAKYVSPNLLHWTQSGTLMVMVILGGVGRLWGGVLGAALLLGLEELFSSFTLHTPFYIGAVLLAAVLFAPRGLAGLFSAARDA